MDKKELYDYLEGFKNNIVKEAKNNTNKFSTTGTLKDSIKGVVNVSKNSIQISFTMRPYGFFKDRGVKGTESGESLSGYSYKSGAENAPPPRVFHKWAIKKGLSTGKDPKTGRFVSIKGLKFALSRHVQKHGIKKTMFFTKPFEKHYKTLSKEVTTKYGLVLEKLLKQTIDQTIKEINQTK